MTFLPIVQRELRVAARRRSTMRVRWWAAVLGLALTLMSLLMMSLSRGRSIGNPLFTFVTGYGFVIGLLAGVFLTADALTEEKRQGTLGLLFLTDLKGYDVVLGKFMAQSLNAFYCLLALLPITALPLLLGGVVGAEFWRMALALANALFFSLAAGIFVSALMRDSQKAMANTLGFVLLLVVALPALRTLGTSLKVSPVWLSAGWASPLYAFTYAPEIMYARHQGTYWTSLIASQALSWVLLAGASLVLPRVLQENRAIYRRKVFHSGLKPIRRTARQAELLTQNPVQWLRRDELRFPWAAWLIVMAWAVAILIVLSLGTADSPMLLAYMARPFGFGLKLLFAIQACRFFTEARRNGSLELLLCTPLTDQQIVRGQIKALWLAFAWPLALFITGLFAPFGACMFNGLLAHKVEFLPAVLVGAFSGAAATARLVADLFAILWFGMGLALTSKKPALAPALTILFVLVLPAPLSFCYLDILIDLIFISWGTSKCRQNLRRLVAEQYQMLSPVPVHQPASSLSAPPVIGANA